LLRPTSEVPAKEVRPAANAKELPEWQGVARFREAPAVFGV
jgi:hypothetical protein